MGPRPWTMTIRGRAVFLGGIALCTMTGCWQEIEYRGPEPDTARRPAPRSAEADQAADESGATAASVPPVPAASQGTADAEANAFADDLANSLDGQPAMPVEPVGTALSPALDADRYPLPAEPIANVTEQKPSSQEASPPPESVPPGVKTPGASPPAESADSQRLAQNTADYTNSLATEPTGEAASNPAGPAAANTRLRAWLLGSQLSLAALANDRGVAAENVQTWLANAKSQAAMLGAVVEDLPETGAAGSAQNTSRQVLNYLFVEGQRIGRDLAKQHGEDHAALVEVAVKSNLLLVLYAPASPSTEAISAAIAQAAPRAQLPAPLWQPLLDLLAANAEPAEVRKGVQRFHADVERHLSPAAEH